MEVSVYRNLTKGCLSIRSCEGITKGKVIAHAEEVALSGVKFHVGKYGQSEVRRTGHKNVHAFVTGYLVGFKGEPFRSGVGLFATDWCDDAEEIARSCRFDGEPFTYNPYKYDGFVSKIDERIVSHAADAYLSIAFGNYAASAT